MDHPSLVDRRRLLLVASAGVMTLAAGPLLAADRFSNSPYRKVSDAEWKKKLEPAVYNILRQEGTEAPWSSPLLKEHRKGTFACAGCGLALFKSDWKFESGTGWPSFYDVLKANVGEKSDHALAEPRVEYHCAQCLGHQGHVFRDGPKPTGLRYCNDGLGLKFVPA